MAFDCQRTAWMEALSGPESSSPSDEMDILRATSRGNLRTLFFDRVARDLPDHPLTESEGLIENYMS
jgi:hypothetical protein